QRGGRDSPRNAVFATVFSSCASSRRTQNAGNRMRDAIVTLSLALEVFPAFRGRLVVARTAILRRPAPLAFDPALHQHPLKGRIERPLLDLQYVFGALLN